MGKKISHLQAWMSAQGLRDRAVAAKTGLSRVHISRIRRGKVGTKKATALRLQAITKIGWQHFIEPSVTAPKKRISA